MSVYCEGLFIGRALVPGVAVVLTEPAVMGRAQALNPGLLDLKSFTVSAVLWKHIWKRTQTLEPGSSQPFLEPSGSLVVSLGSAEGLAQQ